MNRVILMGRLTRDPDIRYSQNNSQMAVARYTLAVDRQTNRNNDQGGPTADFIGCVAFGKSAEFAERFLHKGTKIAIEGRIQTGSYQKDGQTIYTTDVIVDRHEFCESKGAASQASGYGNAGGGDSFGSYDSAPPMPSAGGNDGFVHVPEGTDDNLPF